MITPLPCDVRHYFHTECIENWYNQQGREYCPLCKEEFTLEQVDDYNGRFTELALSKRDNDLDLSKKDSGI